VCFSVFFLTILFLFVVWFRCVRFSFFSTVPRDWSGKNVSDMTCSDEWDVNLDSVSLFPCHCHACHAQSEHVSLYGRDDKDMSRFEGDRIETCRET